MIPMAGGKHRRPKDSSSTRRNAVVVCLGAGVVSPLALAGQAEAAPTSAWDRIAECESNGRWNLPYGDASSTGGLQIQQPTWADYGGLAVAPQPYMATKAQQIMIAEKILAGQGPGAWTCNAKMGFPLGSTGPNSSHLKGGINPNAATPAVPARPAVPAPHIEVDVGGWHTVKPGDTLYGITKAFTGNAARDNWKPLLAANAHRIKNPDLIYPGQRFALPWARKGAVRSQAPVSPPPVPRPVVPIQGDYVLPVHGRVGDGLIVVGNCVSRVCGGHSGVDIMAPSGTIVRSAAAGTVVSMNASGAPYGLHVVVKHAGGIYTLYAHLSAITVHVGQSVRAGQQVGNVGTTGASSGPHLHFEVRTNPTAFTAGVFLNPVTWLRSHGITV